MTYSATVLADSPVAYWRLGEASGTSAADATGHAHTGTYVNSPTLGSPGLIFNDTDTAVAFNGTTQYVSVPTSTAFDGSALTLEAWFKTTSAATESIIDRDTDGSPRIFQFRLTSGKPQVILFFGGTPTIVTAPTAKNDGQPHHMVATWNGTTITMYVDGVSVATGAFAGPLNGGSCSIGIGVNAVDTTKTAYFSGTIDEAAIYTTALSSARVVAHYSAGAPVTNVSLTGVAPNVAVSALAGAVTTSVVNTPGSTTTQSSTAATVQGNSISSGGVSTSTSGSSIIKGF